MGAAAVVAVVVVVAAWGRGEGGTEFKSGAIVAAEMSSWRVSS